MEILSLNKMESIHGGDPIAGACVAIGAGSAVYTVGLLSNWWNPVGWVSAVFVVVDIACIGYAASQLE